MSVPDGGERSSDDKIMAVLAYVGLFFILIPTLVVFFIKKDQSVFIKKHCLYAFALAIISIVLNIALMIISVIPVLGWIVGLIAWPVLGLVMLVAVVYLIVKVCQGEDPSLPLIGDYIDQNFLK